MDQVPKEKVRMAALAVVLVLEILVLQSVVLEAKHHHLVKVMMAVVVVAVTLTPYVVLVEAEVLVQLVVKSMGVQYNQQMEEQD